MRPLQTSSNDRLKNDKAQGYTIFEGVYSEDQMTLWREEVMRLDGVDISELASGENNRQEVFAQFSSGQKGNYMIARKDYKYFYLAPDDTEFLFDRINDPNETRNRAGTPFSGEVQKELKARLLSFLHAQGELDGLEDGETGLDWKRYPYPNNMSSNPDAGLLVQAALGSVVPIEGCSTRQN